METQNMDFRIDPEIQGHLRPLSKAEYDRLAGKIEYEGCAPGALVVAEIDGERLLIDGHNTVRICQAKGIPFCEPRVISLPDRNSALEWIEENQQSRRNASQEEMQAIREKRIARIVIKKRDEGKSNRLIAEEEGISEKQVRNDLAKATAEGYAVEPEGGKTQGKDGKERPATKPSAFCDRCQRVGPVNGCPQCAELKSASKPSNGKPPKAPKPGSIKYDWNASDKKFGAVVRWPDEIGRAYPGEKQSTEYKRIDELLIELAEVRAKWHKRLKKIKEA